VDGSGLFSGEWVPDRTRENVRRLRPGVGLQDATDYAMEREEDSVARLSRSECG